MRQKIKTENTSIEVATYKALQDLHITFEPQYPVGRYRADAFLPLFNCIVEVQGDYWHCNPDVYSPDSETYTQKKKKALDEQKRDFYALEGYRLIELWEKDIKEVSALALLEQALEDLLGS